MVDPPLYKMQIILLALLLSANLSASTIKPTPGLYKCMQGNEESICDQILKPYFSGDKLTAIKVEYVGYCGSMGPYLYYCANDVCENAGLKFEFHDRSNYRWENKQYGLFCEMTKK